MNPTDITSALIYGLPLVSVIGYGYESLISSRGRSQNAKPSQRDELNRAISEAAMQGDGYQIKVAESLDQFCAAQSLIQRRYMWRGYQSASPSADPASLHSRPSEETTLIVESSDAIVGTITVRTDGPSGLLAEATHPDSINDIRTTGIRVCEVTQLAVCEDADHRTVLAKLLSVTHCIARKIYLASDILIEVNPRHVNFYCRVLGFIVAAEQKICERVGAPSVLLRLELTELERRFQKMGMGLWVQPLLARAA